MPAITLEPAACTKALVIRPRQGFFGYAGFGLFWGFFFSFGPVVGLICPNLNRLIAQDIHLNFIMKFQFRPKTPE